MNIRKNIRELLAINLCIEVDYCNDDANLYYDLGADSLSLLSFAVELDDQFGLTTADDSMAFQFHTVEEILDKAEELCQSKNK